MRKPTFWIVLICFLIPTGFIFYKHSVLNLTLLPQKVDDVWQLHISLRPKDKTATTVTFPIPREGDGIRLTEERMKSKGIDTLVDRSQDSAVATWISKEPILKRVSYNARVDISPVLIKNIPKDLTTVYPRGIQKYLRPPMLDPVIEENIRQLEKTIFDGPEDKTSLARKAFYYVDEEVQRNIKTKTFEDLFQTGTGSPLVKAQLFAYLCRRHNIPARIVAMLRMPLIGEPPEEKYQITFANEVFLNNRWIPVDTNRGHFGERPDRYLVLHRHWESIDKIVSRQKVVYTIRAQRAVMDKFNKAEYRKEIMGKGPVMSFLSLYRLPLQVQAIFSTILLIPIGTLMLCFARNILGVPTFGMFTPILLTVFFKETSLVFGLSFFLAIVLLGLLERHLIDKLHLLAVPRLSILLTLVIIMLMLVAFTGLAEILGASHIGYFPIVIVTVFIERFSIMLTEDGPLNTFKTLLGTVVISMLSFSLYSFPSLEILMFTNPELLFVVMGLLILIGKYKGYRVSEFIRFQDLVRQVRERSKKA